MPTWTPPAIIGRSRNTADGELFTRLGLDVDTIEQPAPDQWTLTRDDETDAPLKLVRPDKVHLSIDFTTGKTRHRTTESGKGAQVLSKALGIKQYFRTTQEYPLIIDATGGMGKDSWALASIGCSVIVIERHPVVHALLEDGLLRAVSLCDSIDPGATELAQIANRISLVFGDATQCLGNLFQQHQAHAIYLDPMYPERRKKANSKKDMQFLHALSGPPVTDESLELLHCAINCRASRVAVKRPAGAPLLAGSDSVDSQRTTISSPNTRYDVYHQ